MDNIAKYIYEVGQLKRVKRSGWWIAGIDDPESVAEHSFRTAVIGYLLAVLADADPMRTSAICVFHDIAEARINDMHRIERRYLDVRRASDGAFREQVYGLPHKVTERILEIAYDEPEGGVLENELAHDADLLECIIQAIEYRAQGHEDVEEWITGCRNELKHPVSIELAEACLRTPPSSWWQGLKARRTRPFAQGDE